MSCKQNSIIRRKILTYYENNKRDLPWRTEQDNNQNAYFTLVSEIMLQQTQVNTALVYYVKFVKKWPNLNSLAKANIEDILTMWSGLGYYSRAKNLLKAAKTINEKSLPKKLNKDNTLIVVVDNEYLLDFQYQTEIFKKKINALLESNTICKIKLLMKK